MKDDNYDSILSAQAAMTTLRDQVGDSEKRLNRLRRQRSMKRAFAVAGAMIVALAMAIPRILPLPLPLKGLVIAGCLIGAAYATWGRTSLDMPITREEDRYEKTLSALHAAEIKLSKTI